MRSVTTTMVVCRRAVFISPSGLATKTTRQMLELLLRAGSNINAQNIVGDAPLHKAALNGRALSADYLIRAGANVNIRNEFAQTPLHAACVSGNIEVVQRLVQGGADTGAQDAAEVRKYLGGRRGGVDIMYLTTRHGYVLRLFAGRMPSCLVRTYRFVASAVII